MAAPNILFICADQLGAKFLGCYGSGIESTPNLDRLAARGVRYDRYYDTHPVCAPNRATMLTGRSASAHGVVANNYALATDMPTYAHVLRTAGYRTGGFGKFHQTPMQWAPPMNLDHLGFDEAVVSEDPKWGPYIDWIRAAHPDQYDAALAMADSHAGHQGPSASAEAAKGASAAQISRRRIAYEESLQSRIAESEWERMYASPISPEAHDTTFITEMALDFVKRQTPDRPFLCHVSYVDPHDPYDPPAPYASLFAADDMPDPLPAEWREQGPGCVASVQSNYLNFQRIAGNPEAIRRLRSLYHGQLALLDSQIGRLIESLERSGAWENTYVVFTTDHGEHLGDHGMIAKGFAHYDAGIRCPLIVSGGPMESDATRSGASNRLSCTLDLFPTFCDWADIPPTDRPPLEGRSLADVTDAGWDEVTVTMPDVVSLVSSEGFRLTWYPDAGEGQLFNLADDPDESANVERDPRFADTRRALLERLVGRFVRTCGTPHYRNLPYRDEKKWNPKPYGGGAPQTHRYHPDVGSPWLTPGRPRPEWRGG